MLLNPALKFQGTLRKDSKLLHLSFSDSDFVEGVRPLAISSVESMMPIRSKIHLKINQGIRGDLLFSDKIIKIQNLNINSRAVGVRYCRRCRYGRSI